MTTQPEARDELVGAALAELPVPDHRPGFDAELRELLAGARGRRRAHRRPLAVGAVAAALAAVLIPLIASVTATETASAADVRRAVERALASIDRLSGVVVSRESSGETRWRVVVDARGNFRAATVGHPVVFAYSADDHVERISDSGLYTERVGVAPGPPDSQSSAWMLKRGLGSVVGALAAGSGEVQEVTYRGRDAWLLRTHTQNAGEERHITVDRETGLPVRDVLLRGGRVASEWRLEDVRLDERDASGGALFRLERGPGQELTRWDNGFRRAPLERLRAEVGYAPLVPGWLPEGFRLADSAFARTSRPTGNEQRQNPPSRDVVSLAYRRGLDEIVITTRRAGAERASWTDPVAMGDLSRTPERVLVRAGWLAGSRVEAVVDPNAPPHVWGVARGLVVTVTGAGSRDDLLRIVESLRSEP